MDILFKFSIKQMALCLKFKKAENKKLKLMSFIHFQIFDHPPAFYLTVTVNFLY